MTDKLTLTMTPELREKLAEAIAAQKQYLYVSGLTTKELDMMDDGGALAVVERAKGRMILSHRRLAAYVLWVYENPDQPDIVELPALGATAVDIEDILDDMPPDEPEDPVIW